MRPLTPREQVIAVVAGVVALFFVVHNWLGLGDVLERLGNERTRLETLRSQYEEYRANLRLYPRVQQEYQRYRSWSIPRDPDKDPADEFTEYVNGVIRRVAPNRRPVLRRTEIDDIEGVDSYLQILLPIDITVELGPLVEMLKTFDRERLLIRKLDIRCRENQHPNMNVRFVLSRFVPAEDLERARPGEEEGP